jgi:hypothetical protein
VQVSALMSASSFGSFLRGPAFAMVLRIGGGGDENSADCYAKIW